MVLKQGPATRRRDAGRGCSCVGAEALHPWCNWHAWALYWAGLGERASRREADLGARVPELQRDRARAAALLHRVVGPRARGARPACNTRHTASQDLAKAAATTFKARRLMLGRAGAHASRGRERMENAGALVAAPTRREAPRGA